MSNLVIFELDNKPAEVRLEDEILWLSLQPLADLFGRDKSVISRHLKNIFETKELDRSAVVAKNATTAKDEKTYQVDYYNLDVIISVSYRVNFYADNPFSSMPRLNFLKRPLNYER